MNLTLNERARRLADQLESDAEGHRVQVHLTTNGARVIDCGIAAPGGIQAGLMLARICLADFADVSLSAGTIPDLPCPAINVRTDHPVLACMASQYAGWQVSVGKFFAMGSGPMRAAYGKEELFQKIPGKEQAAVVVGVLESRRIPDDDVVQHLCEKLGLAAQQLTLVVAPAASIAGTMQVVARSIETALHKLYELGFDLTQVRSGLGAAPLPPVALDEIRAIGRTNDAILYGGQVSLWVDAPPQIVAAVGPKVPSSSSSDHGAPFAAIFERYQRDFYKIDPLLFSPAQIVFHNLRSGKATIFGKLEPEILRRSFFTDC